jgi:hypothetical protein
MGFEEFQRQQKELKEQDRQKKTAATTGLNSYKGGGHDIKHTKALTDIRAQNRLRKVSAVRNQHGYKEYRPTSESPEKKRPEQVKEEVVADVSLYSNDDDDDKKMEGLPQPGFTADRIGETEAAIEAAKREAAEKRALLDARKVEEEKATARESAKLAEEAVAVAAAAEEAAKRETEEKQAAEEAKAAEEEAARIEAEAKAAEEDAARIEAEAKVAEEDAARIEAEKSATEEEAARLKVEAKEIAEAEKQATLKVAAEAAWKVKAAEDLARAEEEEVNRAAAAAVDAKQKQEIDELADEWSKTALDKDASSEADKPAKDKRDDSCQIDLDFTFGLFYPSSEPPPEWDVCTQAAAGIVPNKIRSGKTPVSYDPEFPPEVKTIKKDGKEIECVSMCFTCSWFLTLLFFSIDGFVPTNGGQIGLYRYIVRGIVPVYLQEKIEVKSETAPVRRDVLKKQSCFVPVGRVESAREIVVENEQVDQWKRVRKGKPVAWEEIVEKKPMATTKE